LELTAQTTALAASPATHEIAVAKVALFQAEALLAVMAVWQGRSGPPSSPPA